jgi:hypothetical protein
VLTVIRGNPVMLDDDGMISFTAGATIDGDGGFRTYCPASASTEGLDYLANAGGPGNWYGVVTGVDGRPVEQGASDPFPGCYVSSTTYVHREFHATNPRRYLDSETELFTVIPGPVRLMVRPVVIGCLAVVTYRSKSRIAVVGDVGPATHLGEVSIALAAELGIPSSPKNGGVDSGVIYKIFPGIAAPGYELQRA